MEDNKLIIYKNSEGNIIVDAIYKDETLWLSQKGMSKVFECSIDNISLHLKHIFEDNELDKKSVTEKCSLTADDGKKYNTTIYSLDAIIAVGYRINSKKATEFRIWATKILKEYIIKCLVIDDERLKNPNYISEEAFFKKTLEKCCIECQKSQFVRTAFAQIPWSQNMLILDKIKEEEKRV